MGFSLIWRRSRWEIEGGFHTSATSAESSVSVATLGAHSDNLAVNVFCVVGVDVAGTAATVRDFGS
jgi:hypothetical protein